MPSQYRRKFAPGAILRCPCGRTGPAVSLTSHHQMSRQPACQAGKLVALKAAEKAAWLAEHPQLTTAGANGTNGSSGPPWPSSTFAGLTPPPPAPPAPPPALPAPRLQVHEPPPAEGPAHLESPTPPTITVPVTLPIADWAFYDAVRADPRLAYEGQSFSEFVHDMFGALRWILGWEVKLVQSGSPAAPGELAAAANSGFPVAAS